VLPSGVRDLSLDLVVGEPAEATRLVHAVSQLMPEGPTTFVKRPWVASTEELTDELSRLAIRVTVARGSEWLAESYFADVLKKRARDGLIVHGPISFGTDESAERTFARTTARMRWSGSAA
jgi:hypothetical protein